MDEFLEIGNINENLRVPKATSREFYGTQYSYNRNWEVKIIVLVHIIFTKSTEIGCTMKN